MLLDHWKNFWKSWGFVCKWQTDMAKCKKTLAFWHINVNVAMPFGWLSWRWTGLACAQQPFWLLTLSWKSARGVISSQKTNNQPHTWCLVWCRFFPFTSIDVPLLCQISGVYSCVPGFSRFWVWGLCFGAVVKWWWWWNHLFLGLMEIIPTQIANQWKTLLIWQATSLIQPSTAILCVKPALWYRHQFNRQSLWFSWLWWRPFFSFNMFRPYQLCSSTLIISSTDKTKSVFQTISAKEAMVNPCQFIIFGEMLPCIGIGTDSYLSQIPMKKQQDFLNDNFPPPQKNWGVTL